MKLDIAVYKMGMSPADYIQVERQNQQLGNETFIYNSDKCY